jgi:hypothetical protein
MRHPFIIQGESLAGLGSFGYLQFLGSMDGGNFQIAAKSRLVEIQGILAIDEITLAVKKLVRLNMYYDIKIAGWATFAPAFPGTPQAHLGPGINPGRYFQSNFFPAFNQAYTITVSARVFDYFAFTTTLRTGCTHPEKTLGPDHLPPAVAG